MQVKVNVIEGKDLLATDLNLKSDPYMILSINGVEEKFQTKVIEDNRNPVWDETFLFKVPTDIFEGAVLEMNVFDKDPDTDDEIGRATQPLNIFKTDEEIEHSLPLTITRKGKNIPAGSVNFKITISKVEEEEEIINEGEAVIEEEEEEKIEDPVAEEEDIKEEDAVAEEEEFIEEEEVAEEEKKEEDDERIKKLKERIEMHHQRYIALEKGETPALMKTKSASNIPASPKKSRAKKSQTEEQKYEEEEETEEEREAREEREQQNAEAEEKLNKEVEAIKKKVNKKYNALLSKYKFVKDNEKVIKKQKKMQEDAKNGNLESMSVDQLKNVYLKLKKDSKNLDKEIDELKKQIEQ